MTRKQFPWPKSDRCGNCRGCQKCLFDNLGEWEICGKCSFFCNVLEKNWQIFFSISSLKFNFIQIFFSIILKVQQHFEKKHQTPSSFHLCSEFPSKISWILFISIQCTFFNRPIVETNENWENNKDKKKLKTVQNIKNYVA